MGDRRAQHPPPQHSGEFDVVGVLRAAGDFERSLESRVAAFHCAELGVEIPGLEVAYRRIDVHLHRMAVKAGFRLHLDGGNGRRRRLSGLLSHDYSPLFAGLPAAFAAAMFFAAVFTASKMRL